MTTKLNSNGTNQLVLTMSAVNIFLFALCMFCVVSSISPQQCGTHEVPSTDRHAKTGKMMVDDPNCNQVSTLACNSCKDCSPCFCKSGYIRAGTGEQCITDSACQKLHVKWLEERKNKGKNSFCRYEPAQHSHQVLLV